MPSLVEELRTKSLLHLWGWVIVSIVVFISICGVSRWRRSSDLYPARMVNTALRMVREANKSLLDTSLSGNERIKLLCSAESKIRTALILVPREVLGSSGINIEENIEKRLLGISQELDQLLPQRTRISI